MSTAYLESKFSNALLKLFPIATLLPEATITFFNTGTSDSFNIVWYIGSTYNNVFFIGTIIICFVNFVPVVFKVSNSADIASSSSICLSNCIGPTILLSAENLYNFNSFVAPFVLPTK